MITIGSLMAVLNGLVNPLMFIVFGEMTDSFIQDAKLSQHHNTSNPSECSSAHVEKHQVPHAHVTNKIKELNLCFTLGANSTLEADMQRYVHMHKRVIIDALNDAISNYVEQCFKCALHHCGSPSLDNDRGAIIKSGAQYYSPPMNHI